MFKVFIHQFQKIFTYIYTWGVKPYAFSFSIFLTVLLIFFINIIRYIFFLIGKLFPKTAIFKGVHIYLTILLEYFLVGDKFLILNFTVLGTCLIMVFGWFEFELI